MQGCCGYYVGTVDLRNLAIYVERCWKSLGGVQEGWNTVSVTNTRFLLRDRVLFEACPFCAHVVLPFRTTASSAREPHTVELLVDLFLLFLLLLSRLALFAIFLHTFVLLAGRILNSRPWIIVIVFYESYKTRVESLLLF